jgi:hypothetical protein
VDDEVVDAEEGLGARALSRGPRSCRGWGGAGDVLATVYIDKIYV